MYLKGIPVLPEVPTKGQQPTDQLTAKTLLDGLHRIVLWSILLGGVGRKDPWHLSSKTFSDFFDVMHQLSCLSMLCKPSKPLDV